METEIVFRVVLVGGQFLTLGGVVWVLKAVAAWNRWRGTVDERLEGHGRTLQRHEHDINRLENGKGRGSFAPELNNG